MRNSMNRVFLDPQGVVRRVFPAPDQKMLRVSIREHALYVAGRGNANRADGVLARTTVPGYVLGIMAATYVTGDVAARFTYL